MPHANIIAVANPKGGVAKTTTVSAFASGLKRRGFKVLAIDLSPNGNLSDYLGADNHDSITVYDLLRKKQVITEAIQSLEICDIVPANILLAGAEEEIINSPGWEQRLSKILEPISNSYDYIIIDTPPSLRLLTINALSAAKKVLIPCTASLYAAIGISQLSETIACVKKYSNKNLEVDGVLFTKYYPKLKTNEDMKSLIASKINTRIYNTYIHSSAVVEEAQGMRMDIYKNDKESTVAKDYEKFIVEFLKSGDNNTQ